MNINIFKLFKSIAFPLLVGITASLFTQDAMRTFDMLNKPPLSPPPALFPIVWTILYILMGISSYLIQTSDSDAKDIARAQSIYQYQLVVNFLWPVFFFNFQWYLFSFFWLLLLWALVALMIKQFYAISKIAALLNIPYLLWLTFAAYLNLGIWWLNR